jgi:hypothetical protein
MIRDDDEGGEKEEKEKNEEKRVFEVCNAISIFCEDFSVNNRRASDTIA